MNQFLINHQLNKTGIGVTDETISDWISGLQDTFSSTLFFDVTHKCYNLLQIILWIHTWLVVSNMMIKVKYLCWNFRSTPTVTRQKTPHLKLVPDSPPTPTTLSNSSQDKHSPEVQKQIASFSMMTPTFAAKSIHPSQHHHNSATTVDLIAEDQREVFV